HERPADRSGPPGADAVRQAMATLWSATPASASGGVPLPADVQEPMSRSFGVDFSDVRIHENSASATALNALAYTRGVEIHFAPGQYAPATAAGRELLGHELVHVVQQSHGRTGATAQRRGETISADHALEHEADDLGARAARGESLGLRRGSGGAQNVQLKPASALKPADKGRRFRVQLLPGRNETRIGMYLYSDLSGHTFREERDDEIREFIVTSPSVEVTPLDDNDHQTTSGGPSSGPGGPGGLSGVKAPPLLGLGCDGLTAEQVLTGIRCGYRMFDLAVSYRNHKQVTAAIRAALEQRLVARSELFLIFKFLPFNDGDVAQQVFAVIEQALGDLGVNSLDCVMLHAPASKNLAAHLKALKHLVGIGKVLQLGLSNVDVSQLQAIHHSADAPKISFVENEFSPLKLDVQTLEACVQSGIRFIGYSVLGGRLRKDQILNNEALLELAEKFHVDVAQLVLAWAISLGVHQIPKSTDVEHMTANLTALELAGSGPLMAMVAHVIKLEFADKKHDHDAPVLELHDRPEDDKESEKESEKESDSSKKRKSEEREGEKPTVNPVQTLCELMMELANNRKDDDRVNGCLKVIQEHLETPPMMKLLKNWRRSSTRDPSLARILKLIEFLASPDPSLGTCDIVKAIDELLPLLAQFL
ncbi:MAG TPA: aldo/keto reductase, partial [Kofleriaceae bacterium]